MAALLHLSKAGVDPGSLGAEQALGGGVALCSSSIPQAALGSTGTLPSLAAFGLVESHLLGGAGERI